MTDHNFPLKAPQVSYENGGRSSKKTLVIILSIVVVLVLIAGLGIFGAFVVRDKNRLYYIPSESMAPTLQAKDRVRTEELSPGSKISRGDIVIGTPPAALNSGGVHEVVKRVVAMPGETIEARNGVVYINGNKLIEPYLAQGTMTTDIKKTVVLQNSYFLLGDNRTDSADSRIWGPVARNDIQRRAVSVVTPVDHRKNLKVNSQ